MKLWIFLPHFFTLWTTIEAFQRIVSICVQTCRKPQLKSDGYFWTLHSKKSSEDLLVSALRHGLQGDGDMLGKARMLDSRRRRDNLLQGQHLFGSTIILSEANKRNASIKLDIQRKLEHAGVLIVSDVLSDDASREYSMNCRDIKCAMNDGAVAANAVAGGHVCGAAFVCDNESETIGVSKSISWAGTTGCQFSFLNDDQLKNNCIVSVSASSLKDAVAIWTSLQHISHQADVPQPSKSALSGIRIALVENVCLHDIPASWDNKDALEQCEKPITWSLSVAAEMFKNLGANVTRISFSRSRPISDIDLDLRQHFDLLMTPASRTAAFPANIADQMFVDDDDDFAQSLLAKQSIAPSDDLLPCVLGQPRLIMPCGVVATDDDGYGREMSAAILREGLPIAMMLTAISAEPSQREAHHSTGTEHDDSINTRIHSLGSSETQSQSQDLRQFQTSNAPPTTAELLLTAGFAYERATRWSSEVFAAGMTREQAKEDMDDVRECYGVYFATTLLRYMARRTNP